MIKLDRGLCWIWTRGRGGWGSERKQISTNIGLQDGSCFGILCFCVCRKWGKLTNHVFSTWEDQMNCSCPGHHWRCVKWAVHIFTQQNGFIDILKSGWIVTFVIRERGGGHNAGYISSGFFGGMTLGRVALMWFNRKVCSLFGRWLLLMIVYWWVCVDWDSECDFPVRHPNYWVCSRIDIVAAHGETNNWLKPRNNSLGGSIYDRKRSRCK